jgi:alpha-N-acetylglucosamine transferase
MKKVLTSFGFGSHAELMSLASPTFSLYANKHNYDLFIPSEQYFSTATKERAPSWWKIELIKRLFDQYDRVLWIDSDVIICDYEKDIFDDLEAESHVGMVVHEVPIGFVPNCGVWLLDKKCLAWFNDLWKYNNLPRSDGWWEQNAMLHLLGIETGTNNITLPESYDIPWTKLDYRWNPHIHDHRKIPSDLRFFHSTMFTDRAKIMKSVLNQIGFMRNE